MALPAGAQAQGQGKKILIYTGTTGFRHTDGINGGRPVIQSRLEGLGYTVAWEDCSSRATLEVNLRPTHCNHPNQNPRVFTAANLAQYDAIVFLNSSWSWGGGGDAATGPLLEGSQKDALVGYLQNGGGIAAIHNMTDAGRRRVGVGLVGRQPELGHRHHDARPRGHQRHRQRRDGAGRRQQPPVDEGPARHVDDRRRALQLPAQRPRRPSRARHVRRAHVHPGRQRRRARTTRSPGASSTTAPTSTTARRRRRTTPTAARGTPAWATSVCATPRTAATTTWST